MFTCCPQMDKNNDFKKNINSVSDSGLRISALIFCLFFYFLIPPTPSIQTSSFSQINILRTKLLI